MEIVIAFSVGLLSGSMMAWFTTRYVHNHGVDLQKRTIAAMLRSFQCISFEPIVVDSDRKLLASVTKNINEYVAKGKW